MTKMTKRQVMEILDEAAVKLDRYAEDTDDRQYSVYLGTLSSDVQRVMDVIRKWRVK